MAVETSGLTADEFKMLLGVETTFVEIETEQDLDDFLRVDRC